jgi:autotransporter-associated beta strand protein
VSGNVDGRGNFAAGVIAKRVDEFGTAQPAAGANPGDTSVALNDSGADRLKADYQANISGTTFFAPTSITDNNGVPASAANPLGQFPGNATAIFSDRQTQMRATQTQTITGDNRLASDSFDSATVAQNQAGDQAQWYRSREMELGVDEYKKSPASGFDFDLGNSGNGNVAANGGGASDTGKLEFSSANFGVNGVTSGNGTDRQKVPVLGDVPLEVTFATHDGSAVAAAPAPAPSGKSDQMLVGGLGFFDDSYNTAGKSVEAAKELTKTGGGAVAMNGVNTYSGGTVINNGTLTINNSATTSSDRDQDVYVFPVNNADPNQAAQVLRNMFASSTPPSGTATSALQNRVQSSASSMAAPAAAPPGNVYATNLVSDSGGNFSAGLTKDDVSGMRYLLTTNNISRESAASSKNDLTLNFQNAPLDSVLNYLSDKAGLIIVQGAAVGGNVTLSGNHLTQDEVLTQLNSQLNRNGYVAIRDGRTLEIVSKEAAKTRDVPLQKAPEPPLIPQPEILTSTNAFSTFSMNVSDVSFKLAEASLQKGRMPDAASIRSEEFINAFDYRDPEAAAGQPVAFASERAQDPFAQNRDLLRFSIKTAAAGRAANRPLNLVLLLDTSGSMERADRVAIIREAMRVLAAQLHPQDTVSVVTFARVARLWADGVSGDKAGETLDRVGGITPEGGTNLEEAMRLAYQTALRHYLANGANRVVLLTDGAANLGNVDPGALKQKVEAFRKQGIALDCFGIGWEDYDDTMLAELSGNGDGRYAFINSPEEAGTDFAAKLAGALQVAAQDVKVQVEFNPQRVTSWRQIGYAKHQLTKEQFRDNSVLAAEIAAQEAGNALYTVEIKPDGAGPVATVYVRYKIPGTMNVEERSWSVPYDGNAPALEQSSAAMRLAGTASAFSEWLAASPFAQEVTTDELLRDLSGVPQIYGADQRPQQLEWMIRQAKSLSGK